MMTRGGHKAIFVSLFSEEDAKDSIIAFIDLEFLEHHFGLFLKKIVM